MTDPDLTFQTATRELEEILRKLDGDDVNIDSLTVDLERASELIEWCRERLETTQHEVERIVTDLDNDCTSPKRCEPRESVGTPSVHGTLADWWETRSESRALTVKVHASLIFNRTSREVRVPNTSVQIIPNS